MCKPWGLPQNITVQRCVKRKQKIVWAQLSMSMAGDVHSGGQDWHPSAGMRYRLRKSEMGISRQWRAALYHVHGFSAFAIFPTHNQRATAAANMLKSKVLVIGINHSRPNSLKRKSPGKRPKPSF